MQQTKENSILNVLGYGLVTITSLFLLSACSRPAATEIPVALPVEVRTVQVPRPSPIVPAVDQVQLRDVNWIIVTPDNAESVFASLAGDKVLFAVTVDGYESLALNLSDIRAMIQQQQRVIAIYRASYRE
jgi:hypothetical protein